MKKEKFNNIDEWFLIKDINEGVKTKKGEEFKLLEVKPINFKLLSDTEQIAILEAYKRLLRQCNFDIQIIIQSFKTDVNSHLHDIQSYSYGNNNLNSMLANYTELIKEIVGDKKSITRRFFIVLKNSKNVEDKIEKIVNGLAACGNEVTICDSENVNDVLKNYFSKNDIPKEELNINTLSPTFVDTKDPKYITIDNNFYSTFFVNNYNKEMEGGFLDRLISSDTDFIMSIFYEKKNSYETLKDLTACISNSGANLRESNSNQLDIDVMSTSHENAKYIKRMIQVENDELYNLNIYILTYANSLKELEVNCQRLETLALGSGISLRRGIFRQEEIYKSCLPVLYNSKDVKNISKRNVLASGLVSTYPFLSNELCDKKGVLIGTNAFNNSVVMVDRFDTEKYKNANMCVIGASGSGKSYFIKVMIARNRLLNINQFVIDPDREYAGICKELDGAIVDFGKENIINIMEIREMILDDDESYLQNKLQKLMTFFSIIFPDLLEEEKSCLEEKIIECYENKGITFDNNSLYSGEIKGNLLSKRVFKKSIEMPLLGDLYKIICNDKSLNRISKLLKPYVTGALKFMNNYTNVDLNNKLVVADIYNVEEKNLPMILFAITEYFWDKIRENRGRKKIIYLDEVWRLINKNSETADFVFKMFKTIRKYGGAATAITQDVNDFFSLDDGKYGKGILNNSSVKCVFQVEENDVRSLKSTMNLSDMETYKILNAPRGTCLMYAGRNHLLVKVLASDYEHNFISTDRKDL